MFLKKLAQTLEKAGIRYALVGGYAVALHGAARGTVDIDLVVALDRKPFLNLEKALKGMGLVSQLPVTAAEVFDYRQQYITQRNLIAWSFVNEANPIEVVDVIITHDVKAMKIVNVQLKRFKVPIVAIDDLIKMKRAAARPQDLEDVTALEKLR